MQEKYEFYKEGKEPIPNDMKHNLPFHNVKYLGGLIYYLYITFSIEARRERFFRKILSKKKGKILNVGCGGGWSFLNDYGEVTGIDVSKLSIKPAKKFNKHFIIGSAVDLPFKDGTFDFVVSTDLVEHIPHNIKNNLWKEMSRVMKEDGRTIHFISTDSNNWFMRLAKHDKDLYKKSSAFRDHEKIEYPEKEIERIKSSGLRIISIKRAYGIIIGFGAVTMLCEPHRKEYMKKPIFRFLWLIDNPVHRAKPIRVIANMLAGILADIFDRFFDEETGLLVCCEKPI